MGHTVACTGAITSEGTKSEDQLRNSVSTSISSCFTQPGFVDLQIAAHHDELPN